MKKFYVAIFSFGLTMCNYAPAQVYFPQPVFHPPVTINLPDGTSMTCTKMGTVINCG